MGKKYQQSAFTLEGRFLGFVMEDGYTIKRLRLMTVEGEQCIKLSKEARAAIGTALTPGDWIEVWGDRKIDPDTATVKLKAVRITLVSVASPLPPLDPAPSPVKSNASILVCQKSDCWKRGGKAVCQALEAELHDRGLDSQVTVRRTGCMKQCKSGPNVVFMPSKARYSRIDADDVPALIEEYFPTTAALEVPRSPTELSRSRI